MVSTWEVSLYAVGAVVTLERSISAAASVSSSLSFMVFGGGSFAVAPERRNPSGVEDASNNGRFLLRDRDHVSERSSDERIVGVARLIRLKDPRRVEVVSC